MPEFRRAFQPGGTFFFTVVTAKRRPILCTPFARRILRATIEAEIQSNPFDLTAIVLLPDHLHAIWTMPDGDNDFSSRWARIKRHFTRDWLTGGGHEAEVSKKRAQRSDRGVWQPRFWEHTIRDEADFVAHLDYIHFNPVRHGLASCPHAWPHSSFDRFSKQGRYDLNWRCGCTGRVSRPPDFSKIAAYAME